MFRTIMVLEDGSEVSSGVGTQVAVKSCKLTQQVNSGEELTVGSCCSDCVELSVISHSGEPVVAVGERFSVFKESESGARYKMGVFYVEKSVRVSPHVFKITGFDSMSLLDKDLTWTIPDSPIGTTWAQEGGYMGLGVFVGYICRMCGVELAASGVPNPDLHVFAFDHQQLTGRQILQWAAQCCGCFCRADLDGRIEFTNYTDCGVTLSPGGARFYYAGTLEVADYEVAAIDGVRYWYNGSFCEYHVDPAVSGHRAENPYTMPDTNKIWVARSGKNFGQQDAQTLTEQLAAIGSYRPCKLSTPGRGDIRAGDAVTVVTPQGEQLRMLVMRRVWDGGRDKLECTGSRSQISSSAVNKGR